MVFYDEVRSFASLSVWERPEVRSALGWYYEVALNRKPAKYLICRRIASPVDPREVSEEELWDIHAELSSEFWKVFPKIRSGEMGLSELDPASPNLLDVKAELAERMLRHCNFCRWNCRVDRSAGTRHGTCQLESVSRVSSYFHHRGEELPLRGTMGSGTIFFTSCNMRCVFCQNGDISHDKDNGIPVTPEQLAAIMWELRMEGCHNINLVGGEPTIHLHTIMRAISLLNRLKPTEGELSYVWRVKADYFMCTGMDARYAFYNSEFNTPILWNSNMFMSLETMRLLREVVDIWLPDFKFGNDRCAINLSRTPWYFETVSRNHKMIYTWREDIVIRHLVMPNHVECCTKPVLRWIAENMRGVLVNIMDQYHPDCYADPTSPSYDARYAEIARRPSGREILDAYEYARELGLNYEALSLEGAKRFYLLEL